MSPTVRLPSRFGRTLAVLIWILAAIAVAATSIEGRWADTLHTLGPAALAVFVAWLAFWRPEVCVSDGGITVRNVFRTVHLPWPSIQRVETKYSLTLYTTFGRYTAWAAPAPGLVSASRAPTSDYRDLGTTLPAERERRASDNPATDSGQAALVVRERWQALREAGHLDTPTVETERPSSRAHWLSAVALVALIAASIISVL